MDGDGVGVEGRKRGKEEGKGDLGGCWDGHKGGHV